MKRRSTLGLFAILVLAGLGAWMFLSKGDARVGTLSEPQPQATAISEAQPATRNEPTVRPAKTGEPTTSAVQTSHVDALIQTLARSYQSGTLPVRIRLQDQLSRHWDDNPPSAAELLALVGNRSFPPEMRTYLARSFANRVKMRAYSDDENAAAFTELRSMVTSEDEDSLLRADLANVLTTIDDSDEAVEVVAGLLDDENPQAVRKAVSALTHTMNPLAIEAAYEFVQDDERLLKENPTALLAALAPLSTTDKDLTPMLNRIVRQTDDFKLYAGAVQCLIHAKPTVAVLESIAQAFNESKRFPQHAAQAEQMCRAAAGKHARFFNENRVSVDGAKAGIFGGLMKEGAMQ
jgi:xanthine/CO dehydrogenase XdhC/CoxF family maturation factor